MEITPEIEAIIKEKLDAQKTELTATFEESVSGLKKSQQDLLSEKKAAKDEAEAARLLKAAKDKDVDTLSASYEQKLQEIKAENAKLMNGIKQAEIHKISSAFVDANVVDDPFIRQAMNAEYSKRIDMRDGRPVVLNAEGGLTAMTLDDLNQEIKSTGKYSSHLIVSKSSGGGANGSRSTGGASATIANLGGSTAEKSAALVNKIPALASLPVR